ncbi:hypothetical protein LTS17_005484 [Exophiala oligosperma]
MELTYSHAIDENIPIDQFPKFFEDARLNFAENMLCGDEDRLAIVDMDEQCLWTPRKYTWTQLRDLVSVYSSGIRAAGLRKGDAVTLIGGNCARSLALLLATASVGCLFSSFATDIGEKALSDRLVQLEPKLLFAESTYWYNGKKVDISTKIDSCTSNLSNSCATVIIGDTRRVKSRCTSIDDFIKKAPKSPLKFEQVPFNTPLVVMFSSGTTGTAKGIVHSHGGLVLNGYKEHKLHNGFGPEDVHFHFSNIGWTLWNISIGALFCKSTMVLYDGSPFYPNPDDFLKAVFANGVTAFGAGPRYYDELQKRNVKPRKYANDLHTIFSTGAVLTPALATWLIEAFGPVCQIGFSGGTELCGSFMHGTRSLPSYPGEISVKALGMDIAAFSPDGTPVPEGEAGELVCRKPFPNMPAMFLRDPDKKRYHAAYFEGFPHVWTHGDFMRVNPETNGIYVLGRSDGTLNPSGVRFGSSEIYNILSTPKFADDIADSIVVGQQRTSPSFSDSTERVLLFIKCRSHDDNTTTTTTSLFPPRDLDRRIREQIATDLTRRHVPSHIFQVAEIPYNVNGKKMEIQVKAVVNSGASATTKQRLNQQEVAMLKQFEKFHHLEKLLENAKAEGVKAKL